MFKNNAFLIEMGYTVQNIKLSNIELRQAHNSHIWVMTFPRSYSSFPQNSPPLITILSKGYPQIYTQYASIL